MTSPPLDSDLRHKIKNELWGLGSGETDYETACKKVFILLAQHEKRVAVEISPTAQLAMVVAQAQLERNENPTQNVTATLLMELERIERLSELRQGK